VVSNSRFMGTTSEGEGIRTQLMSELKAAMKAKDSVKSTLLRSVLSEVYATDKAPKHKGPASSAVIVGLMRQGLKRRLDTASQYEKASRPDLAAKEKQEAELLQALLPPLLSEADIDKAIRDTLEEYPELVSEPNAKKAKGILLARLYTKVDSSNVDGAFASSRAEALLTSAKIPTSA